MTGTLLLSRPCGALIWRGSNPKMRSWMCRWPVSSFHATEEWASSHAPASPASPAIGKTPSDCRTALLGIHRQTVSPVTLRSKGVLWCRPLDRHLSLLLWRSFCVSPGAGAGDWLVLAGAVSLGLFVREIAWEECVAAATREPSSRSWFSTAVSTQFSHRLPIPWIARPP